MSERWVLVPVEPQPLGRQLAAGQWAQVPWTAPVRQCVDASIKENEQRRKQMLKQGVCICAVAAECHEVKRILEASNRLARQLGARVVTDSDKLITFMEGCKNGQRRRAEFRTATLGARQ